MALKGAMLCQNEGVLAMAADAMSNLFDVVILHARVMNFTKMHGKGKV